MSGRRQASTIVDADLLSAYSQQHHLSQPAEDLLQHLIDEAAPVPPGLIDPFEPTTCATEFRLGARSGRRTIVQRLVELSSAGALQYTPRLGKTPGRVLVLVYEQLLLGPDLARVGARQAPDLGARQASHGARLARVGARSMARANGRTKEEDSPAGTAGREGECASAKIPEGRDWSDDELEELLGELIRLCDKASPPIAGMTARAGVLAAVSPYSRRQVRRAAAVMSSRLRGGERIHSPFGLLVRKAKQGAPEYFTIPPLAAATAVRAPAVEDDAPSKPGPFLSINWDA